MVEITSKSEFNRIKIYINNLIHISIPKDNNTKIQSWYEDKTLYKIEIYNSKHLDEYHYEKYEIWSDVLKELDKYY